MSENDPNEFEAQASQPSRGMIREFLDFLRTTKKWWLLPLIVVLLLLGVFIFLGSTGAAPFVYALF